MTKPASKPEFARDGEALVTDPGASKRHAGFLVDEAVPAHWLNWLLKNVSEWIEFFDLRGATDELTYATPRSHTRVFSPQGGTDSGADLSGTNTHNYGNTGGGGVRMQQTSGATSGLSYSKPLNLAEGSVITGWRSMVLVDFFGTGGASVSVQLRKRAPDWNGPSPGADSPVGAAHAHTGSNATSVQGETGLSETVLPGTQYYLQWSSTVIGVALLHVIEAYELTWTETRATGNF